MKPSRVAVVLVALAGCNTPPAAIRNDGAVDGGGSAGAAGGGGAGAGGHGGSAGGGGGGAGAGAGGHGGSAGPGGHGGGAAGAGGHGEGGADASVGDAGDGAPVATFDSGLDGFVLDNYHDFDQTDLGDPSLSLPMPPTLTFDGAVGNPAAGSLAVRAPFSGANQYVDIQKPLDTAELQNWAGKKLRVRLRVDAGSTFSGIAQLYVDTTAGYLFGGTASNVAAGSDWQEIVLDVGNPSAFVAGYDPTEVILFGIQLNSGSAGFGATPATFHLDTFTLE